MRFLALLALTSPAALARTGGPDTAGWVFTDSNDPLGPSPEWLDSTGGDLYTLADGEVETLELPFEFIFYGTRYSSVGVTNNGALRFDGELNTTPGACPGAGGTWTGVAAYWDSLGTASVSVDTFGTYPYRTFVVSWDSVAPTSGTGSGSFQAWLLEGRNEVVVVHDDLTFGDAAVDDGVNAVVGVANAGEGLEWSCATSFFPGTAIWFGDEASQPARPEVSTSELDLQITGDASFQYLGDALLSADLNDDGSSELIMGAAADGGGAVYLFYGEVSGTLVSDAQAQFEGTSSGDDFGSSLATGDHNGDGLADLAVGAPGRSTPSTDAGAAYVFFGDGFSGTTPAASNDRILSGHTTGRGALGTTLAFGDTNGDGYDDVIAGSPTADDGATDGGLVAIMLGAASPSVSTSVSSADTRRYGSTASDKVGSALLVADLDSDGQDDLLVGAPGQDGGASNGGAVYTIYGPIASSAGTVASIASCRTTLNQASAQLGLSIAVGDVDGSGVLDVLLGAPYADSGSMADAGQAFLFEDPAIAGCSTGTATASATLIGTAASSRFGTSLAIGELNGTGDDDVAISAPNSSVLTPGGGAIYVFTSTLASGIASSANHVVYGAGAGDAAGSELALGYSTSSEFLAFASPTADETYSGGGAVYQWDWHADYQDDDSDGFVAAEAGGNDCDDADASAIPGGAEPLGDSTDGDCDGWTDDTLKVRTVAAEWEWDVEQLRGTVSASIDFEGYTDGAAVTSAGGVSFSDLSAADVVSRTYPVGDMGSAATTGSLTMTFDAPVDALALRLLDPEDTFVVYAWDADGDEVVAGFQSDLAAAGRTGGLYRGYTFLESASTVTIEALGGDIFGIDELEIVSASSTDRDLDGESDDEGDCDDADAEVNTSATEVLGNGKDDDCDGIVDGGSLSLYTDETTWSAAAGLVEDRVDFESPSLGDWVDTQYDSIGVNFDGVPQVASTVDGVSAIDAQAIELTDDPLVITFTEAQPAVGLTLLDVDGTVQIEAYSGTTLVYSESYAAAGGQEFLGLVGEYPVDELIFTVSGDTFGADDVIFSALGLDDSDGDGLTEREGDCDDADAGAFEGAEETWYDGVDSDCAEDNDYDADGDGVELTSDCDDTDSSVSPTSSETWYDGVDGDCSGGSDYDADGDGADGSTYGGTDCDDADASIYEGAPDTWYDGIDSDCAGNNDYDLDGDGASSGPGGVGGSDCDDTDATVSPDAEETYYDGIDNDCDPTSDDEDQDDDGHVGTAAGGDDCNDTLAATYPGAPGDSCYDGEDTDCDGASDYDCDADGYDSDNYGGDDCDDADVDVSPAATDTMGDGLDTNCDGGPEYDFDGDGFDGELGEATDCDDDDAAVNPDATEVCYDGLDANCDGESDYDCDLDGDLSSAYGGGDCDDMDAAYSSLALDFPYDGLDHDCDGGAEYDVDGDGAEADWYGGTDCDDTDATVGPGAIDACYDGIDSDCAEDEDYDCDGDGVVSADHDGEDCDDASATTFPGAPEIADDGIDQDCSGADLETCTDCDGDGVAGLASGGTDCDDEDEDIYPGASDAWYDGTDSDCAGNDDYDKDGDGDATDGGGGGDCDDLDAAVSSLNTLDDCGSGDEDCDGRLDEDCDTTPPDDTADTGEPDDTGDTGDTDPVDTADSGEPDVPGKAEEPITIPRDDGCGCDTSGDAGALVSLMGLLGLAARRRSNG